MARLGFPRIRGVEPRINPPVIVLATSYFLNVAIRKKSPAHVIACTQHDEYFLNYSPEYLKIKLYFHPYMRSIDGKSSSGHRGDISHQMAISN